MEFWLVVLQLHSTLVFSRWNDDPPVDGDEITFDLLELFQNLS